MRKQHEKHFFNARRSALLLKRPDLGATLRVVLSTQLVSSRLFQDSSKVQLGEPTLKIADSALIKDFTLWPDASIPAGHYYRWQSVQFLNITCLTVIG